MAVNSQANKHLSLFIGEECIDYPIMSTNDVVDFEEAVILNLSVLMQVFFSVHLLNYFFNIIFF